MIFGVGIDIENHIRFEKYFKKDLNKHLDIIFSQKELSNYSQFNSHLCHAISFSGKESFLKALGVNYNDDFIPWNNIEFFFKNHPEKEKAKIKISGIALDIFKEHNIINPPAFKYNISDSKIIFETILSCKKI